MMVLSRSVLCLTLLSGVVGCAHQAPAVAVQPAGSELKLFQPLPELYTAGQPSPQDWRAMRARGISIVINLRTPGELKGRDEAEEVRAAGLLYAEIPVAGADGITAENARLLHTALGARHRGVLVHCASGNRVGALLALEQVLFDGMPKQDAMALGKKAGLTGLAGQLQQTLETIEPAPVQP